MIQSKENGAKDSVLTNSYTYRRSVALCITVEHGHRVPEEAPWQVPG